MQQQSVFVTDCLCGRHLETSAREFVCPACHRHILLEWGRDPELELMDEEPAARETAA
jgi:hypothetical protein